MHFKEKLMHLSSIQLSICLIMFTASAVQGANVLGLFPITAKSAFVASEAVMKGLAARGHNVTVLSCFPQKSPIENYTDISIRHLRSILNSSVSFANFNLPLNIVDLTSIFLDQIEEMSSIIKSDELQRLLSSNIKFDVVFHEMFVDNVFLMIARKFKAPIIALGPSYIYPWAADRFSIPDNPAYIPVVSNSYSGKMNFYERVLNTITYIRSSLVYWLVLVPKSEDVYSRYFKEEFPSVTVAARDVSMYFVNSHFSLYGARPYPPQVVEIGGIHLQPAKKLPEELAQWMDKSVFGIIYFSFGSILKGASMPPEKVDVFREVFRKLPQQVLWKWEDEDLKDMPNNVKIMKWLPQKDVLGHPKVRLFISHGGLMGTTEAIIQGVPILGIPTNMDQGNNVACLRDMNAAIHIDYNNITVASIEYAIHQLLHNQDYKKNAMKLSQRFLDRPMSPLDTAVYWTEYVIRHRGAPHLQSAAVHLTWYQYYLLDVIAVLTAAGIIIVTLIYYILKSCLKICCIKSTIKEKSS